jgi:hypothetical protein
MLSSFAKSSNEANDTIRHEHGAYEQHGRYPQSKTELQASKKHWLPFPAAILEREAPFVSEGGFLATV